jgi:RHS repeat-associated protein
MVVNSSGTPEEESDFSPFGTEYVVAGPGANQYKFTGKERDTESGLDDMGARYYSAGFGRFLSADPLLSSGRPGYPQSWNRYAYTLDNPLRYVDPTGLYEWDASLGGSLSDKQLKKRAGKNKAARKQANSIIKQRKAIREQLNRLSHSGVSILQAAANAIGQEGSDNGVTVATGSVGNGGVAEVQGTVPLATNQNGNPELTLTVAPGSSGDGLFVNLAHEGTHVADAQAVEADQSIPAVGVYHYQTEIHAYMGTVAAAQFLNWSSVGPVGGPPFWSSSWSSTDQQTRPPQEIFRFLMKSPTYKPTNFTPAYVK